MRKAGAITLGQDEASSLIYGMPRVAFERGAVMRQFSLSHMADAILDACEGDAEGAAARQRIRRTRVARLIDMEAVGNPSNAGHIHERRCERSAR